MINSDTITIKDMYNLYNRNIIDSISMYEEDLKNLKKSKDYFLGNLELCENYIKIYTQINYDEIINLKNTIPYNYYNNLPIFEKETEKTKNLIFFIVETNKKIEKCELLLKKELTKKIDYKSYKKTIELFNKKISFEILKGYELNMGHGLSRIRIKKHIRNEKSKKRIDWDASNRFKKDLLAKGLLPYKVLTYDENKKPIENNGGVMWFVYHEQENSYSWYWRKALSRVTNNSIYKFRPTVNSNTKEGKYELGNANKLQKLVKENSEILKNYLT